MAVLSLSDPELRAYVDDVRQWHGYVRFLGLPTLQDHPDTPLSDLFVAPRLSAQRVAAESPAESWPEGGDVLAALLEHRRLVVLGDPGSGKSTLVNWLAWLLAGGASGVLPSQLEDKLPLPLVARELKLDGVERFDDLLKAFLERPVAARLRGHGGLSDLLRDGRVLVLLDGLDEVSLAQRQALRKAVLDGWRRYPNMLFLATSRIVGYEECALAVTAADEPQRGDPDQQAPSIPHDWAALAKTESLEMPGASSAVLSAGTASQAAWLSSLRNFPLISPDLNRVLWFDVARTAKVLYVMPFDDGRIAAFANQWYRLRSIKPAAEQDANAFMRALHRERSVLELARTPQLLTLMALVYRIRAHLPDGRAMLYDMITEAYLESIDRARSVGQAPVDRYPWREKRRWLARVGFEMQLLRGDKPRNADGEQRELLVNRRQVLGWVREAMRRSSYPVDEGFADTYLDWVARRSGLLLPRGEDLFAFVHLSFQEYFAALYVVEHAADADWVIAQRDGSDYADGDPRVTALALRGWGKSVLWQEVLVFAHESFAHNPKDARRLSNWIFGEGFDDFIRGLGAEKKHKPRNKTGTGLDPAAPPVEAGRGELLARLVVNPHSGLTDKDRQAALRAVMEFLARSERRFAMDKDAPHIAHTSALRRLLETDSVRPDFWKAVTAADPESLFLLGGGEIDLADMRSLTRLKLLTADSVLNADLDGIRHLKNLSAFFLAVAPRLTSLEALASLPRLAWLCIPSSQVRDITPLSRLPQLTYLDLRGTGVTDLSALRSCKKLIDLFVSDTPVTDLSPLADLPNLRLVMLPPQAEVPQPLRERKAAGELTIVGSDVG